LKKVFLCLFTLAFIFSFNVRALADGDHSKNIKQATENFKNGSSNDQAEDNAGMYHDNGSDMEGMDHDSGSDMEGMDHDNGSDMEGMETEVIWKEWTMIAEVTWKAWIWRTTAVVQLMIIMQQL